MFEFVSLTRRSVEAKQPCPVYTNHHHHHYPFLLSSTVFPVSTILCFIVSIFVPVESHSPRLCCNNRPLHNLSLMFQPFLIFQHPTFLYFFKNLNNPAPCTQPFSFLQTRPSLELVALCLPNTFCKQPFPFGPPTTPVFSF